MTSKQRVGSFIEVIVMKVPSGARYSNDDGEDDGATDKVGTTLGVSVGFIDILGSCEGCMCMITDDVRYGFG